MLFFVDFIGFVVRATSVVHIQRGAPCAGVYCVHDFRPCARPVQLKGLSLVAVVV